MSDIKTYYRNAAYQSMLDYDRYMEERNYKKAAQARLDHNSHLSELVRLKGKPCISANTLKSKS